MDEKAKQIILQAAQVFMRLGLKSPTMDDVCRELGISKKTLYQIVSDKGELISRTLDLFIEQDQNMICMLSAKQMNAIEEMMHIMHVTTEKLQNFHPSIMFDMQKYYPEAFQKLEKYRKGFMLEKVQQNIIKGQQEGLYRSDVNPELTARFYVSFVSIMSDPNLRIDSPEFSYVNIIKEHSKYHLIAIATGKGLSIIKTQFELNT